jgi:hypothetical protein
MQWVRTETLLILESCIRGDIRIVSITTAQRQLQRVRTNANEGATVRLPLPVSRQGRGETPINPPSVRLANGHKQALLTVIIKSKIRSTIFATYLLSRWIDDRIYLSLIQCVTTFYNLLSHTRAHTHTHTTIHRHVFTGCCSIATFNRGRSFSSGFPNYFHASATSYSNQQLTRTSPQQFTNSPLN